MINPGFLNFDFTESGRRKKNIGNTKYISILNPPEKNANKISDAENSQAKFQFAFLIPKWKNVSCAASSRKALVVVGYPSAALSIAITLDIVIAAATRPARVFLVEALIPAKAAVSRSMIVATVRSEVSIAIFVQRCSNDVIAGKRIPSDNCWTWCAVGTGVEKEHSCAITA